MTRAPEEKAAHPVIKMLHVFPSFGYGGQQARFAALAAGLGPAFSHRVAALDGDLSAQALLVPDAPVELERFILKKSSLASPANVFGLRRLIGTSGTDILCTYNWGSIEAALANRLGPNAPHIHFEDGFGPDEAADRQTLRRVLARRVLLGRATVVVPSRTLEQTALKIWKLKPDRIRRMENGVDFMRFQKPPSGLRSAVAVGAVGALRREKNHRRLITAFAEADRSGRATLTIIGAGPEREALLAAAKDSPAAARISLPGPTAAPENVYCDFDVFALSSDTEQAPLSLMEAMAAGLPVVATNVGDVAEMVADENRVFVTPPGDDEAFTLALTHLIQDPAARAALGAANRKKAREEFDFAPMIARHKALYLETAGRDG